MQEPFAPKQLEYILNSTKHWNLAHGSVRSGKTVGTLFRFMQAAKNCPDSQIFMVGHTSETIYQNAVRLLMESEQLAVFRPFCTWQPGRRQLKFLDKTIQCLGAKDEGAIGQFQGKTMSLVYCDEMTLYPDSIIDMIDTRLSNSYSMGFASMNPSHPNHKCKQWIDLAEAGDKNYYSLLFTLDDNPYVDEDYKIRIRNSLSGLFYKRNYLGLWCLAEGAIFDFFDRKMHILDYPPAAAEYFIAAIDYGSVNAFACLLIGVSTGRYTQTGKRVWVEKEYYWDSKKMGRQKTNAEYADDVCDFLEPYGVRNIYIDPSAQAFQIELQRRGLHVVHANNNVENGIQMMTSEMKKGNLYNGVSVPWIKNASYDLPLITGPSAALNLNGYSSIFAGVIIQWGVVNASGTFFQNADSGTVTFSTPFPLTAVGVFTQPCWTVPIPPTSNATIAIDSSTLTNISFSWNFVTGSGSTYNKFFWWAIGF